MHGKEAFSSNNINCQDRKNFQLTVRTIGTSYRAMAAEMTKRISKVSCGVQSSLLTCAARLGYVRHTEIVPYGLVDRPRPEYCSCHLALSTFCVMYTYDIPMVQERVGAVLTKVGAGSIYGKLPAVDS